MNIADSVARFFSNSPKRQASLEHWIVSIFHGEKQKKVKEMCRTRWVGHHEAFEVFSDLFLAIFSCLEDVANSQAGQWNRDSQSDAQSLLLGMSRFSFIFTLEVTKSILAFTKGLSVNLQGRYVDVARAHREIESVKATIEGVRFNVSSFHDNIYSRAAQMAQSVNVEESTPRISNRQQHRLNIQAEDCSSYYRLNLTVPLLDHLISELNTRFDTVSSQNVIEFLRLLPSTISQTSTTLDQGQLQIS